MVLVDALADHLGRVQAAQGPVQRWRNPEENITEAIRWLEAAEFSDSQSVVSKFSGACANQSSAGAESESSALRRPSSTGAICHWLVCLTPSPP